MLHSAQFKSTAPKPLVHLQVGGNCAIDEALATAGGAVPASVGASSAVSRSSGASRDGASSSGGGCGDSNSCGNCHGGAVLVSRSGKAAGASLAPGDFVRLTAFDRGQWAADYESPSDSLRPSSDAPLLWACLAAGAQEAYGWGARPRVAFHGHALESGAGAWPVPCPGPVCVLEPWNRTRQLPLALAPFGDPALCHLAP